MHFNNFLSLRVPTGYSATSRANLAVIACAQLLLVPLAPAADVPLKAAIGRAAEAAQIGELQNATRRETESYRQAASALPNPSLFYERETLNGSGPSSDSRETTFGLAAPLDFIWKRGTRIETAELRGEFAILQIEEQRRQLTREVGILFAQHSANLLESQRHEAAHVALDRAKAVAQASVDTGDAPPTLLQRVDLAISRHAFEENRIQTELLAIQTRFATLLADDTAEPDAASLVTQAPSFTSSSQAKQAALENRPDLKAAAALFAWKRSERKAVRREGLPEVSLEAAQREDNIGRDGVFLGLSVELPIFERNQAAANIAQAESVRAEIGHAQARRLIEGEARSAFLRWQKLDENWRHLNANIPASQNAEALLTATEASFEAGESSLLEYLDTVEAYLEAAEREIELQKALRLAAIELAYVTGTSFQN